MEPNIPPNTPLISFESLSRKEKISLTLKRFLAIKAIAYSTSAMVGAVGGTVLQNQERASSGYDPIEHARLKQEVTQKKDFEEWKKDDDRKKEESTLENITRYIDTLRKTITNPQEAIKNTDMYKQTKLQFLDTFEYMDKAVFWAPAIFLCIMLGGFIDRTLRSYKGNAIDEAEKEATINKLNEMIGVLNSVQKKVDQLGEKSLTSDEVANLRSVLASMAQALPSAEELKDIDADNQ